MAEALVILEKRRSVTGHLREVAAKTLQFSAPNDTWTVPGIRRIEQINLAPMATIPSGPYAFTIAGNIVTLLSTTGMIFTGAVVGI